MILVTSKDKTHLELNDKQLSILMSALSCATLKWNKIKDKKVKWTQKDLWELSEYIIKVNCKGV